MRTQKQCLVSAFKRPLCVGIQKLIGCRDREFDSESTGFCFQSFNPNIFPPFFCLKVSGNPDFHGLQTKKRTENIWNEALKTKTSGFRIEFSIPIAYQLLNPNTQGAFECTDRALLLCALCFCVRGLYVFIRAIPLLLSIYYVRLVVS